MIHDELELDIKRVSADLQILEEQLRANSTVYQRLMGQLDMLIKYQKKKESDKDVGTDTGTETQTSDRTRLPDS